MIKHNQNGAVSAVALSLVVFIILFIAAASFGIWAYQGRQDYKNNVDSKISAAVQVAVAQEGQNKDAYYAAQEKLPLTTFTGPSQYGSLNVVYPKTWSAYVDDTGTGSALLDGYFNPSFVPSISDQNSQFALRVQVVNQSYTTTLQNYSSQEQQGTVTAKAYALPKLPSVVGVELSGQLTQNTNSVNETMVVLPLRSYTLLIWTDGTQYLSDFNNNVLPNFSFSP